MKLSMKVEAACQNLLPKLIIIWWGLADFTTMAQAIQVSRVAWQTNDPMHSSEPCKYNKQGCTLDRSMAMLKPLCCLRPTLSASLHLPCFLCSIPSFVPLIFTTQSSLHDIAQPKTLHSRLHKETLFFSSLRGLQSPKNYRSCLVSAQ